METIADLEEERARLEEEIKQLRAAVQLYAEVARRLGYDPRTVKTAA
jgi:DNA-binding CsgD family transcriptional regulator